MRTEKEFLKESVGLNVRTDSLTKFYRKLVEFMAEYYRPSIDWTKMMEIEERHLWPVLRGLGDPTLPIYDGAKEEVTNEFIITIKDEIAIRLNMQQSSSQDHREYLRLLSMRRIDFFEKILQINSADRKEFRKGSSWVRWLITGGTVIAVGIIGKSVIHKNKEDKK